MVLNEALSIEEKLAILSGAAKYDVACTSSGLQREGKAGEVGNSIVNNPGVNTSLVRLSEIKVPVLQKSRFR